MPRPAVARRSALLATVLGTASTIAAPAANAAPDGGRAAGPSRLAAPGRYPATPVPNLATRHLLNRFSYGVTPELRTEAVQAGGAPAWFEKQLNPANIADPVGNAFSSWFPNLWLTPGLAWDLRDDGMVTGALLAADLHRWTMLRKMYSSRQVLEVMVEFWSNVLHVPAPDEKAWPYRVRYDQVIRKNALGRYDDMLVEAVLHPAMLCYLDNAVSSSRDPNENLGREVLECHTVGQESGLITETAVKNSTMILTGYMVDMWETWAPFYSEDDHFTGPVISRRLHLGQSRPGRPPARQGLSALSRAPPCHRSPAGSPALPPLRVGQRPGRHGARHRRRVPCSGHRHQRHPSRPRPASRVSFLRREEGADTHRGLLGDLPHARAPRSTRVRAPPATPWH